MYIISLWEIQSVHNNKPKWQEDTCQDVDNYIFCGQFQNDEDLWGRSKPSVPSQTTSFYAPNHLKYTPFLHYQFINILYRIWKWLDSWFIGSVLIEIINTYKTIYIYIRGSFNK